MLQGEEDVGRVELRGVLLEAANLAQVEEELATGAVLEAEVQLGLRLKGVVHLDDELVVHAFLNTGTHTPD